MKGTFDQYVFLLSSCLFAAGAVVQMGLDIFYPIPSYILDNYRTEPVALGLGLILFILVSAGLLTFIVGFGRKAMRWVNS